MERSAERLDILKKIDEYEKNGWFDRDVEDDPPTIPLVPDKVDYTQEKLSTRIRARIANAVAYNYFESLIKNKKLIIDEIIGTEMLSGISGGAVITCNHFNSFDNYAVYKALGGFLDGSKLFKVIREGNYTSFGGIYGYFFRNCDTLPISMTPKGIDRLFNAAGTLLARGNKILIYPEQGMWWNYKKPRPLKTGAFRMAVKNNVPVIPLFITMKDTAFDDMYGFPVQAYTVHICAPIYPDAALSLRSRISSMLTINYEAWKRVYQSTYGVPLEYGSYSDTYTLPECASGE